MVKINKSSMHSRITGDFAERLVLYWLSKYGFESMYVDHVGIDLVAKNPKTNEKMGISVKSRSRSDTAKKGEHLNIGKYVETKNKILKACKAFDLVPYFAIVVDEGNEIIVGGQLRYFGDGYQISKNIGGKRADFAKINVTFRKNWHGDVETLTAFMRGSYYTFKTGVSSDSSILPGAIAEFELIVPKSLGSFIGYSYTVDWEQYE